MWNAVSVWSQQLQLRTLWCKCAPRLPSVKQSTHLSGYVCTALSAELQKHRSLFECFLTLFLLAPCIQNYLAKGCFFLDNMTASSHPTEIIQLKYMQH